MDREYESNMGIAHKCEAVGEERSCETCQESQRQRCPYLHRLGCTVFTPGQARAVGSLCRFYAVRFVSSATQYKLVHPDGRVEGLPLNAVLKAEPEPTESALEKWWRREGNGKCRTPKQWASAGYTAGAKDEWVRVIEELMAEMTYQHAEAEKAMGISPKEETCKVIKACCDRTMKFLDKLGGAG